MRQSGGGKKSFCMIPVDIWIKDNTVDVVIQCVSVTPVVCCAGQIAGKPTSKDSFALILFFVVGRTPSFRQLYATLFYEEFGFNCWI